MNMSATCRHAHMILSKEVPTAHLIMGHGKKQSRLPTTAGAFYLLVPMSPWEVEQG